MLIKVDADTRGRAQFGWLDSNHTFSFGHYYDPNRMGWGPLRVINEDRVIPGAGFDTHGHKDMEIISYVLDGALEHKDSIGNGSVIRPGRLQRMTAGTGIRHSEYNHSKTNPVHFLQIWIIPEAAGLEPGYEEKEIARRDTGSGLTLIGSRDGREDSITIHQNADLYVAHLNDGESAQHKIGKGRIAWVQVARGSLSVNGETLRAGDGAAIKDEDVLVFDDASDAEALVFDMAA
ncbi:pirin family protein [Thalassospira sp. HF15]|uniref:pirin family protein n=1 Tax=Thalassospira sp. HF15 TaxID=2722755 RepID=UPI001430A23F|nr:pirin family protein [Thalassospira sp. HF15]NIY75193.1 pirin family protein [Thalassospira sp. HF15]